MLPSHTSGKCRLTPRRTSTASPNGGRYGATGISAAADGLFAWCCAADSPVPVLASRQSDFSPCFPKPTPTRPRRRLSKINARTGKSPFSAVGKPLLCTRFPRLKRKLVDATALKPALFLDENRPAVPSPANTAKPKTHRQSNPVQRNCTHAHRSRPPRKGLPGTRGNQRENWEKPLLSRWETPSLSVLPTSKSERGAAVIHNDGANTTS